mgnify:FL=1
MQWASLGVDTHSDLERVAKIANNVSDLNNVNIAKFIKEFPLYGCPQEVPPQEIGVEKLFIHPEKINFSSLLI